MTEYRICSASRICFRLPKSSANPAIGLVGEPRVKTDNHLGIDLMEGD